MSISRDTIEVRKNIILEDLETVKQRLSVYEQKKIEDTALLNALTGAFQQCELFLKTHSDGAWLDIEELENS